MRRLILALCGTLALAMVLSGLVRAQGKAIDSLSAADKDFVTEAAAGSLAEVELGYLAKEKAVSEDVRKFGQHMVEDHGKTSAELKELAGRKGVAVPTELTMKHKALKEKLSQLKGAEFDKQYMREMVKDHEKDIAAFQKEAQKGKDGDLATWAKQTLPTLEMHLKMARDCEAKTKKAGA